MSAPRRGERAATVRVCDLVPGDRVEMLPGFAVAVYVGQGPHPYYSDLRAVTWAFPNGHPVLPGLRMVTDALDERQEVGVRVNGMSTATDRVAEMQAFIGGLS